MLRQETFLGRRILAQSVMRKTYQLSIPTVKNKILYRRMSLVGYPFFLFTCTARPNLFIFFNHEVINLLSQTVLTTSCTSLLKAVLFLFEFAVYFSDGNISNLCDRLDVNWFARWGPLLDFS